MRSVGLRMGGLVSEVLGKKMSEMLNVQTLVSCCCSAHLDEALLAPQTYFFVALNSKCREYTEQIVLGMSNWTIP